MNETWLVENKYEIVSKIKQGGFGIVYVGFDQTFQRPIAIKAVEPNLLNEAKYVDMFLEEAKNAAKLNHNNIVHVYDLVKKDEGQYYIIMEYINGIDLGQLLKKAREKNTTIPINIGIFIIKEICKALEYAHNKRDLITNQHLNLVHQDISPSNIMISHEGQVKLIDFGIAKLKFYKNNKSRDRQYVGKLPYLSPEQLNGGLVNKLTDIFSLGSVFYEILMNERLFNQETNDEIVDAIRRVKLDTKRLEKNQIPPQIIQILTKMLQKDPANRYQGANGIYLDLVEYLMEHIRTVELSNEFADYMKKNFSELVSDISIEKSKRNNVYVRSDEVAPQDIEIEEVKNEEILVDEQIENPIPDEPGTPEEDEQPILAEITPVTSEIEDLVDEPTNSASDSFVDDIELNAWDNLNLLNSSLQDRQDVVADDSKEDIFTETELDNISKVLGRREAPATRDQDLDKEDVPENDEVTKPETPLTPETSPMITLPDDYGQGEDNEKTVIDVIRLSAKSRRKSLLTIMAGAVLSLLVLLVLMVMFKWTDLGVAMYDRIFPPAIKIYSSPQGAEVLLDGKKVTGNTPLTISKISPGVHQLKLIYSGYTPLIRSIQVPSSGKIEVSGETSRKGYEPYLFRFKSSIELKSDPPGAVVLLNGIELKQRTPTSIDWENGLPLTISMKQDQFIDIGEISLDLVNDQAHIEDNRLWSVQRTSNEHSHYLIEGYFKKFIPVSSVPEEAWIYLDDIKEPVGKTGIVKSLPLSIGSHDISFVKENFNTMKLKVDVNEKGPASVFAVLTRNVRFFAKDVTDPEDNEIGATITSLTRDGNTSYLDHQTPCVIPIAPYDYNALVQKNGYKDTNVFINSTTREVIVRMEPVSANVEVFVFEGTTDLPMQGAQIYFRRIDQHSAQEILFGVTDDYGRCKNNIEYGDYVFRVIKDGYVESSTTFDTNEGKRLEFQLTNQ
ncbi:protein kinase [candidate division KSB1 bacterium]|nr:protein kinase [candidate division KSB1 bacterium]